MSAMESLSETSAELDLPWMTPAEDELVNTNLDAAIRGVIKACTDLDLLHITPAQKKIVKTNLDASMKSLIKACAKLDLRASATGNLVDALESLTKASAEIDFLQKPLATGKKIRANLNTAINSGETSNDPDESSGHGVPISIMDFPREIRDEIYPHIFGGYHIHVRNSNDIINASHMESMNGLLIESLRSHFAAAESGVVSERAAFRHGYWPANDLYHRICQRAHGNFPTYECSGKCLDLYRNMSTLSLASLRTCRVFYEEARLTPYKLNSFEFTESNLLDFLRTRSPDHVSAIKKLKFVTSMDRCRMNEGLTQWVTGILQRTCLFKNLTSIMFSAKYVALEGGQLWADGYLMTTPNGLSCQVVLGQDEPGDEKFWWQTLYFHGDLGIMRTAPDTIQDDPTFVNLLPSAPVSLSS